MKYFYIFITLLGFLTLHSCEDALLEENVVLNNETKESYADLVISMNTPSLSVSSRSLGTDPENKESTWTTWEKFCDGALLYRVTLFLVKMEDNGTGTLVGYRNFFNNSTSSVTDQGDIYAEEHRYGGNGFCSLTESYDSNNNLIKNATVDVSKTTGDAVKATFKSSNPMHGDVEKLEVGTYKIIAVANYSPIEGDEAFYKEDNEEDKKSYLGLGMEQEDAEESSTSNYNGDGGNLTEAINNIINPSNGFVAVSNFLNNKMFDYTLNSGYDRICKLFPQPLVMVREITLKPGQNTFRGLLSRTFARIRLEIQNKDTQAWIGIDGLSFQNSYASQKAYLFNDILTDNDKKIKSYHKNFALYGNDESSNTTGTKGNIIVTSDDAIISSEEEIQYVSPQNSFSYKMLDCYILEGKIQSQFAFRFDATYWGNGEGNTATKELHITKFYEEEGTTYGLLKYNLYVRSEVQSSNNFTKLLMANTTSKYSDEGYLSVENVSGTLGSTFIDPPYIWTMDLLEGHSYSGNVGFGQGSFRNLATGLYLQPYDGKNATPQLSHMKNESLYFKIDLGPQFEHGTIMCKFDNIYYYLDCDDNTIAWKPYDGNITNISAKTSETYKYLTFDTVDATEGEEKTTTIYKAISSNSTSEETSNEIVRNDFYWGIIPLYVNEMVKGISLSNNELEWFILGENETYGSKNVDITINETGLTWDVGTSTYFDITKQDNQLVITPKSTTITAQTEIITITCSNGDQVTLNLKVIEKPVEITVKVYLEFNCSSNNFDSTKVTASSEVSTLELSHTNDGLYTFTLTYSSEDLEKDIIFSYKGNKNTYSKTMTVQEFINNYGVNGGTIELVK